MTTANTFKEKLNTGEFVVTAEFLPFPGTDPEKMETLSQSLGNGLAAVNVADNPHGPILSSLAGAVAIKQNGVTPIYQMVTRDRNRIAIQSDLLGASFLGIQNVLCLSGYHQALTDCPTSANVYDLDSIQLLDMIRVMNEKKVLLNGVAIEGDFEMVTGAAVNPYLTPMELNIIRLTKKIAAGASFIQTQPVFDLEGLTAFVEAAEKAGLIGQAAFIIGVMPLASAEEAALLAEKYTDVKIPKALIERLEKAGSSAAQEGMVILKELVQAIRQIDAVRGIHLMTGGKESLVPEILKATDL